MRSRSDHRAYCVSLSTLQARFKVGDIVQLALGYRQCSDAGRGPLRPGEIGHVMVDDQSGKPYRVRTPSGATWWYTSEALVAADPARSVGAAAGIDSIPAVMHADVTVTRENVCIGRRVRRGPNWRWGEQDGRGIGELVALDASPGWVRVRWLHDNSVNTYRIDLPGKYDLVYADSETSSAESSARSKDPSATSTFAHPSHAAHPLQPVSRKGYTCDVCHAGNGENRHRCTKGCDWDACGLCMARQGHKGGEWRGSERQQWCSLANSPDGLLCTHGSDVVQSEHWSCCGGALNAQGCFHTGAADSSRVRRLARVSTQEINWKVREQKQGGEK